MGAKAQVVQPIQNAQHTSIAGLLAMGCRTLESDVVHRIDVQVRRNIAGAAVGATGDGAMVCGDIDSDALCVVTAGRDRYFAAADFSLGVIEGLDNAVGRFFNAVTGDVNPDAGGIVRDDFVRNIGNVCVDLLLCLEIPYAEDDESNKRRCKNEDECPVCPRALVLWCGTVAGLGTGGRVSRTGRRHESDSNQPSSITNYPLD